MAHKSSLAGKYAIVTGSTQGLGEAVTRLFIERGAALGTVQSCCCHFDLG